MPSHSSTPARAWTAASSFVVLLLSSTAAAGGFAYTSIAHDLVTRSVGSTCTALGAFERTAAGFATLCTVRYCAAAAAAEVAWSGEDGNVTRIEIETALGRLRKTAPVFVNGIGNVVSSPCSRLRSDDELIRVG